MTNPLPAIVDDVEAFLKQFRTAQGAVTALALLVSIGGTAGILDTGWTVALKALLSAILGILALAGHQAATVALVRRAASKAAAANRPS